MPGAASAWLLGKSFESIFLYIQSLSKLLSKNKGFSHRVL